MKKVIYLFVLLFTCTIGLSQTDPVIISATLSNGDNFCSGEYGSLEVVVVDDEGDVVTVLSPIFSVGSLYSYPAGGPYVNGDTTTYYFDIYTQGGIVGDNSFITETMSVTAQTANALDPTMTDVYINNAIKVNGYITVSFTLPYLQLCQNGLNHDISQYGIPAGGEYNYGVDYITDTYSNSISINPNQAYNYFVESGGDYYEIEYTVTNVNGCFGNNYLPVSFNENPTILVNTNPSNCGSAVGNASAIISGGTQPMNVYWSNGFSQSGTISTSNISNMSSGVYYVNVTDANGCKAVGKANIYDGDFDVTEDITEVKCQGQPGTIDLSVLVTAGTVDAIIWSNGMTTEDISTGPGEYSVHIHSTANCNFFGTYTIPDSALKVKINDVWDNSNCSAPDGLIDINTLGGTGVGTYSWAWSKNGTAGFATTEDLGSISGGVYSCTVQDGSGCSVTWSKTINNYTNVWLWINEVVAPTCGNADGAIDIGIDIWGDVPASYSWNTGATTEDLNGLTAGNYTLTYTDQAGCEGYLTVKLANEKPYQPAICLLTVDTSLIYNMIVWEKDISQNVSGFNIYRETSSFGVFEKIDSRNYALESFYQDNDASPIDRSWRYYITTYDACGGESYPSFVHKTIHVVSSTSNSIDYDLHWDDYEGITYSSVDVFRFDDVNGWTNVANLPYGTNTYVDTPPVIAGLDYMVSFNLASPCTSTKAQDHNSSRSNKTASVFNGGGSTAQIVDEDLGVISVYPNPASQLVTLHVDNAELFSGFEITDVNGKVIYQDNIITNNTTIDITNIPSGIYFIRIFANDKIVTNKLIVE